MIALVVARAQNSTIGKDNDLPWHLPADLKHFKDITSGHTVIMGRNTFESIYSRLGGPLPNRRNLVISRSLSSVPTGFEVYDSLDTALEAAKGTHIFIIGGSTLYKECLDRDIVDEIFLTEVKAEIDGDTVFPALDKNWVEASREDHKSNDKNPYDYSFVHLRRSL